MILGRDFSSLVARLLALVAAGLLGACATPVATSDENGDIDYAKVAQIERAARHMGTQVIWLRYPTKRVEPATQ